MRISDWSSDVCSSDLPGGFRRDCSRRGRANQAGGAESHARGISRPAKGARASASGIGLLRRTGRGFHAAAKGHPVTLLHYLTIADAAERIRSGKLTALALPEAYLSRIEATKERKSTRCTPVT